MASVCSCTRLGSADWASICFSFFPGSWITGLLLQSVHRPDYYKRFYIGALCGFFRPTTRTARFWPFSMKYVVYIGLSAIYPFEFNAHYSVSRCPIPSCGRWRWKNTSIWSGRWSCERHAETPGHSSIADYSNLALFRWISLIIDTQTATRPTRSITTTGIPLMVWRAARFWYSSPERNWSAQICCFFSGFTILAARPSGFRASPLHPRRRKVHRALCR